MEPAEEKSCTSLKHAEENEIRENMRNIEVITQSQQRKRSITALCLNDTKLVNTDQTREKRKSQFSVKSESYDDVFEKIASEYCEEVKRNRHDYIKKDVANLRITAPKSRNEQKLSLSRQKSFLYSQESTKRKIHRQSYKLRKASRDSNVSNKTVTLVRDNSCSIISIPTYLESEYSSTCTSDISPWTTSPSRPRQQIDLTKRVITQGASRRLQLQAVCITFLMLMIVLGLMGLIIFLITYIT